MQKNATYLSRSKGKSHGGDEDGGTHFGGRDVGVCFFRVVVVVVGIKKTRL